MELSGIHAAQIDYLDPTAATVAVPQVLAQCGQSLAVRGPFGTIEPVLIMRESVAQRVSLQLLPLAPGRIDTPRID